LSAFELGTDIGGSVRIPSHFCGVCGHKPSFGVISQRGYLDYPLGGSTDADINVFGPLARTVDDLSLLLDVLAAPDADRAKAWRLDLPDPRHSTLDGYRIGTWLDDPACEVDTEMGDILEAAADALRSAGAKVDDARPPLTIGESLEVFMPLISAAVSPSMPAEVADAVSGSHLSWLEHDRRRAILRAKWADWFTAHDILLCPVVPSPAFAHDQAGSLFDRHVTINGTSRPHVDFIAWTGLVGVAYLPSTVVPVGWTATGLPVGIQVVAPFLEDRTGLFVAAALEHLLGGYRPPPLAL
jgi:amidase